MSPRQQHEPSATDFNDPTQVAVQVTQLQGLLAAQQLAWQTWTQNQGNVMASMQGELRDIAASLHKVALLQQEQKTHSEAVERAHKRITSVEEDTGKALSKLTWLSGAAAALSAVAGVVVGMAIYTYNADKASGADSVAAVTARQAATATETDRRLDNIEQALTRLCPTCDFKR